jgi:5-formyltetrahydrofolate cyclo-ligase
MASQPTTKAEWRKLLREERRAFVKARSERQLSDLWQALADQLAPHLADAKVIASYWATGSEIDAVWVERFVLRREGVQIALPRVLETLGGLSFHAHTPGVPLMRGKFGAPEPGPDAPELIPDVILVPLVGADRSGRRLGQGGGHYDRALASLRATQPVVAVGLAYDVQLVDTLPFEPTDQLLDALATPSRLIRY